MVYRGGGLGDPVIHFRLLPATCQNGSISLNEPASGDLLAHRSTLTIPRHSQPGPFNPLELAELPSSSSAIKLVQWEYLNHFLPMGYG